MTQPRLRAILVLCQPSGFNLSVTLSESFDEGDDAMNPQQRKLYSVTVRFAAVALGLLILGAIDQANRWKNAFPPD